MLRYRDQDFHLLGIAIDAYLKSKRGPQADAWDMLRHEVFEPIGIHQAPTVRTREAGGHDGPAWFSAGYYPTLDDLAKIALLYQDIGAHGGKQILHRGLTQDLLAARGALDKLSDNSGPRAQDAPPPQYYKMGFHYTAFTGSPFRQDCPAADDVGLRRQRGDPFPGTHRGDPRGQRCRTCRRVRRPCPTMPMPRPAQSTGSPLSEASWSAP